MKHSSGPWALTIKDSSASVLLGPDKTYTDEVRLRLWGGEDAEADAETIANLRLVSAAPDLLAACKEALAAAQLDGWDKAGSVRFNAITSIRAAIAKAEEAGV